jgi:hypothetical protein
MTGQEHPTPLDVAAIRRAALMDAARICKERRDAHRAYVPDKGEADDPSPLYADEAEECALAILKLVNGE